MLWYGGMGHGHLWCPLVLLSLVISWFAGGCPLLEGSPALACGCGLMGVSFLALQTLLEFVPVLQHFIGISGQYPPPTAFLMSLRLCPNEQRSSIHSDVDHQRWSLGVPKVPGVIRPAENRPCGFGASFPPSETGQEKQFGVQV